METLAKRLSDAMKAAGLNQPGLARAATKANAPVSQQVVHHLLSARNTSSKHLPAIAEALGVSLDWLARGGEQTATLRRSPAKSSGGDNSAAPDRMPVLGMAECGPDGWTMWNGDIIDTIPRPSNLFGAPKAYAVYIVGDSMEPRYYAGELAHIHPGKPITIGAFVLVQIRPEHDGDTPKAVLKRLVKRSASKIVLEQYNPPKKFEIKSDDIVSLHRVVGSGES
jgi:phage repressor protein C with HTH and peptisase S24 domain